MNSKFKNMAQRGISLLLALAIMMPTTVFAKDYPASNWDNYKVALEEGIKNQDANITITFNGDGIAVVSETAARFMINNAYEEVKKKLPKYYGELNIKIMRPESLVDGTLLKKATYTIEYKNSAQNFADIKTILNEEYNDIKAKTTDYDKIKASYDYIIDNLDYKSGFDNHDIHSGLKTEDKKSVSADAYAMLFAMMMDDLGYENDIIVGGTIKEAKEPHTWNLVKVQGNWYHVDSRLGEVESDKYKFFLTSDEIMRNNYKHQWEGYADKPAGKIYDKNNSENAEAEFIAREKLGEAERLLMETIAEDDMAVNIAINKAYNITVEVQDLVNALNNIELKGIIEKINLVKAAKDKIVIAEKDGGATKGNIDTAKNAVNQVNAKYINIKRNLDDRIKKLEEKLENSEEQEIIEKAKAAVDYVIDIIEDIPYTESLEEIILESEAAVKTAEAEIKKIKDTAIRTIQQNRIKDIKLVIAAIKAVDKAETVIPPKSTNVTSAKKAIEKIVIKEYEDIKAELNKRIGIVEDNIRAVDAEKLVEKAENSLKRADYDKAKIAVEKLRKDGTEQSDKYIELNNRVIDNYNVILAKEAVENAEKLMKANKERVTKYEEVVETASEAYNAANNKDKYVDIMENLSSRINAMQNAINAIKEVDDAEVIYNTYLINNTRENEDALSAAIKAAEPIVASINDNNANLKSIKKSLQSRLKGFSDKLNSDGDYNQVSTLLNDIEQSLIQRLVNSDNKLDEVIDSLEREVANITEKSKVIKVSSQSKDIKDRITAINDVIAATKAVIEVENSDEKNVSKNITAANKAVGKLSKTGIYKKIDGIEGYINDLINRIKAKQDEVDTSTNESKARTLVDKAISSKKETDIKAAIEAVSKLVDGTITKNDLNVRIENEIVKQLINDADTAITTAISSIERKNDNKSVSKNVTEVNKAVLLAENVVLFAKSKLKITGYDTQIYALIESIKVIDNSVDALRAVEQAEKTKKQEDVVKANTAIGKIPGDPENPVEKYENMKKALKSRLDAIQEYLDGETNTEKEAQDAVADAEDEIFLDDDGTIVINKEYYELIIVAQNAVNKVNDKLKKAELQKRIDSMKAVISAKSAVEMAEAYIDATSVKAAEKALANLVKTDSYLEIVKNLSARIGELNKKLNISKQVYEATKLVQKAVESRIAADSIKARFAVEAIKELAKDSYDRLIKILDELDDSIKNEDVIESEALTAARKAIEDAFTKINDANTYIAKIIEGQEIIIDEDGKEVNKIQVAYEKIEEAKIYIISANAAVRKLTVQKDLLNEIKYANEQIDLAEDNIDVKEAVRLTTIASSSVTNAKTEEDKSQARLDIAAARRAIDRIGHSNNKAIKTTILNTINSIEKKLTSDNDQELIDIAIDAVNAAADMLAAAVRNGEVMEKQEQIDKAIFAAKMAIGWISENNKAAKATLTGFINDIEAMYKAEKEGILNEERIKNAEKAVALAESKKGSEDLDSYIRSARLRVKIIVNDGPDTKVKIDELNARLDALEGKNSGNPGGNTGGGGNNSGGNNNGGNKPRGNNSNGNVIPTTPLPDKDRATGSLKPQWGKTKELKNTTPITGLSVQEMEVFRVNDSKLKIIELSNVLKAAININASLVVRGKNIILNSKPYIQDKVNNSILVPIKSISDELGYTVSLIDSPASYGAKRLLINGIVYGESKSIIMDIGNEYCYVNGILVKMSSKPVIQGGTTYIPIDLMVEYLGLTFSYYNENGNIQLIIN